MNTLPQYFSNISDPIAVAMYNFEARRNEEISFNEGDLITNIENINGGWWMGTCRDKRGLIPSRYVKKLLPGLKCSYQTVCNTCCYIEKNAGMK